MGELATTVGGTNLDKAQLLEIQCAISQCEGAIANLGIASGVYTSDLTKKVKGRCRMFSWVILNSEVSSTNHRRLNQKAITDYTQRLKEEVNATGLPVEVQPILLNTNRLEALEKHFDSNNIPFLYSSIR